MALQKMKLLDFVNEQKEIKSGKIEMLAAFIYWMENIKKVVFATEEEFKKYFNEFKSV